MTIDRRRRQRVPDLVEMNSGLRGRPRLALEITVALIVKLVAMVFIWNVWFSDPASRRLAPERVGAVVYSSGSAAGPQRAPNAGP
jgi:hypothetical protein